jgi:hypothetical protein
MMSFEYTCTCIKVLYREKRSELNTHRPSLKGYINPSIPFFSSSSFSSLLTHSLTHSLTTHRIAYCRYYIILYHCCILSISIAVLYLPNQITCRYHNPYSIVEVSTSCPFSYSSFFFSLSFFSFSFFRSSLSPFLLSSPPSMWSITRSSFSESETSSPVPSFPL